MKYIVIKQKIKRYSFWFLILTFFSVLVLLFDRHPFNRKYRARLMHEYQELSLLHQQKKELVQQLFAEKKALLHDPFYQEKVAREELFLIQKNERIVRLDSFFKNG